MRRRFGRFAAGERGASAIEMAIGGAVVVLVVGMVFDLYVRLEVDGAVGRAVTIMAEYAAANPAPEQSEMQALAQVLQEEVIQVPTHLAVVVSLLRKGTTGNPIPMNVVWSDTSFQVGAKASEVAQACGRVAHGAATATLPQELVTAIPQGSVMIAAEACAKLSREGAVSDWILSKIYRLHVVPVRDQTSPPPAPS